jgi:ubiquinone/menaquinone biosynthesis C-methylase UbiE
MDHFKRVYTSQAAEYHRMIAVEDVDNNLLPALERISPLAGKRILDLGSGTGRLPLLLAARRPQIIAIDLHRAMLNQQAELRQETGGGWPLVQADIRLLPFPDDWADVVAAGWSIGHFRGWYADDWQTQISKVLHEMHRTACQGGALIILETLTTGSLTPAPPSQELAEYYTWLEGEWGFQREAISTDYQFESVGQAVDYTEFFFGPALAENIRQNHWSRLPEWTGMWSKNV